MYEIDVSITILAPRARVFAALSDHERFFRGPGISRCVLSQRGHLEPNGLGAVRVIDSGGVRFIEEVVAFDPPERMDYVVRSMTVRGWRMPLEHELGWTELTETADGTKVRWRSRIHARIPLIGGLVEARAGRQAAAGFKALLRQAKAELEAG